MTVDIKQLRDALDQVEKMKSGYMGVLDPTITYMGVPLHCFEVIMEAARSTLPKPMFHIRVWMRGAAQYESFEYATLIEAYQQVHWLMEHGARKVEIEAP